MDLLFGMSQTDPSCACPGEPGGMHRLLGGLPSFGTTWALGSSFQTPAETKQLFFASWHSDLEVKYMNVCHLEDNSFGMELCSSMCHMAS